MRTLIILLLTFTVLLYSQIPINNEIISRIKAAEKDSSEVMETISYLTDVYGPLPTGTPEYRQASEWIVQRLHNWGIDSVKLESFDKGQRGWRADYYSIEMIEPRYMRIIGYPKAWSADTRGEITGTPMIVGDIYQLDSLKKYKGKLRDKIVMVDLNRLSGPNFDPFSQRFSESELKESEELSTPYPDKTLSSWESKQSLRERMPTWEADDQKKQTIHQQLIAEGPAVILEPSERQHGIVRVTESYFGNDQAIEPVPAFVIASEHFYRMKRMIDKGTFPTLKIQLEGQYFTEPDYNVNVIADIKGIDEKLGSEVVMMGAHLDSWHAGTGSTDNSANCAVLMEVMRIFKALDLKPRRTVRMALWGGEEIGYHGSRGFVDHHIGNFKSGELSEKPEKISIYQRVIW